MATIRASCSDCGDVELTTLEVRVRICRADNQGSYLFRCPQCSMVVAKDADARTIELLVASGVAQETWSLPLELSEPRGTGRSFTHDDLIDFHAILDDEVLLWGALSSLDGP